MRDIFTNQFRRALRRADAAMWYGIFLAALLVVSVWVTYEYNVFPKSPSVPTQEHVIELDEALALGTLACIGLLAISWRLLIAKQREVARRTDAERRAHELAHRDVLTGVANRREFERELKMAIEAPPRTDGAHAVLLLDLNNFKRVNDAYGHASGDEVLVTVAKRLEQAVRKGDLIARLGGDEFAIVARQLTGPEEATSIARRVLQDFDEPIVIGSVRHHVGVGIGIALISQGVHSGTEILHQADIALYRAKTGRCSAFRFFEPEMDAQAREHDLIERELHTAIADGAIHSLYQPLIDLQTKHIVAFEALARWKHPVLGDIAPERFIPIAESCDLINELTDQLIREAAAAACYWPDELTLAVNVSPSQLKDRGLSHRVLSILHETGLPPHRLEIELTESALVHDMEDAQAVLGELRQAGVRIALDDFGTGYSSLYHLRTFHIDKIKIDRSFIANMENEPGAAAVVRALLGFGNGLGLTITAEGVERLSQASVLLSEGCQQAQGYLYGCAVSATDVSRLIAADRAIAADGLTRIA